MMVLGFIDHMQKLNCEQLGNAIVQVTQFEFTYLRNHNNIKNKEMKPPKLLGKTTWEMLL